MDFPPHDYVGVQKYPPQKNGSSQFPTLPSPPDLTPNLGLPNAKASHDLSGVFFFTTATHENNLPWAFRWMFQPASVRVYMIPFTKKGWWRIRVGFSICILTDYRSPLDHKPLWMCYHYVACLRLKGHEKINERFKRMPFCDCLLEGGEKPLGTQFSKDILASAQTPPASCNPFAHHLGSEKFSQPKLCTFADHSWQALVGCLPQIFTTWKYAFCLFFLYQMDV